MTDLVRALQERAAAAMPAEHVRHLHGWWLRHAPRSSWWVGTALPHGPVDDLEAAVVAVEEFYAERDTPPRFQLTPGVCPAALDAVLAARGYRTRTQVSLHTARLRDIAPPELPTRIDDRPSEDWLTVWHTAQDHGTDLAAERALLARIDHPTGYASVTLDGDTIAVGRVVADTRWAGIFSMATTPAARGQGAGRAILAALARWAHEQGTDGMYLQVAQDNPAALRLYTRAGFTPLTEYHYRDFGPSVVRNDVEYVGVKGIHSGQ